MLCYYNINDGRDDRGDVRDRCRWNSTTKNVCRLRGPFSLCEPSSSVSRSSPASHIHARTDTHEYNGDVLRSRKI